MSTSQPPGGGSYAATQEHPQGTVILILGILGFVTGICGLIAWILGSKAQKEMEASGATYSNAGNIKIGKILGIITTLLAAFWIVLAIIITIVGAAAAGSA